jgi:hypothetical protein
VNLKAFCNRFATAAARIWRSASIASPGSTSGTISSRPRTLASICSGYLGLFDEFRNQGSFTMLRNTSPQANVNQDALARFCNPLRLRSRTAPVDPAIPTLPRFITFTASIAVLINWLTNRKEQSTRVLSMCDFAQFLSCLSA